MAVDNIATLGIKVDPRKAITGSNKAKRAIKGIGSTASKVKNRIFSLQGALVGLGAGLALRSSLRYAMSVENLGVQLKFLTGSTEDASKAFKIMIDFASEAPFALQEIQRASPSLLTVAKNVDEMNQLLEITGDIASSSTLTFEEVAQQLQRTFSAGIASADLFRDSGIRAMLGFEEGVSYSAEQSKQHIMNMWSDGTANMKGATQDMAKTLKGEFSLLGDAWDKLQLAFMDAGAFDAVKRAVQSIKADLESDRALEMAKDFGEAVADFIDGTIGMKEALFDVVATIDTVLMKFGVMPKTLEGTKKAIQEINGENRLLNKQLDDNLQKFEETGKLVYHWTAENLQDDLIANNLIMDTLLTNLREFQKRLTVRINAQNDNGDATEELSNRVKKLDGNYQDLNTTLSSTANSFDVVGNKIDRDVIAIEKMADAIKDARIDEIVKDIASSMEDSITNAIMNIGQGVSSLKDMFKDLARIILRQFVQIQVAKPASSWLASNLNLGKLFTPFDGGGFTGAGARTGGVDNKGGFPAILHPNETVIDHTKGSQAGMGGNVNVSFNITANDTDGFDELLESRRGMIINLINSAMNDRGTMGVV